MRPSHMAQIAALTLIAGAATTAHAQWIPNYRVYSVQRIGLFGSEQTGSAGLQRSTADFFARGNHIAGTSFRYSGVNTSNGQNTWAFNGLSGANVQTGLTSAAFTGSAGFQDSRNSFQSNIGHVAGFSHRITGISTSNGQNTWVFDPGSGTTIQTGLFSAAHTGSGGLQESFNSYQSPGGHIAGYSRRITGQNSDNGQNAWAFNPITRTTVQIGLTGTGYSGTGGFQWSSADSQSDAGQVAGLSWRISGLNTYRGTNSWVYNPATGATTLTGLTGPEYTTSTGNRQSANTRQSATGHVAGYSERFNPQGVTNGFNTWAYNPATGVSVRTGLTGPANTGSAGYQEGGTTFLNAAGQAAGFSWRYTGVNTRNGSNAWVYNPDTGVTVQTGLTSPNHTNSSGRQESSVQAQTASGYLAGSSTRYVGLHTGTNTWAFNPVTGATVQIGLTAAEHTGIDGYQSSGISFLSETGFIAGGSQRILGGNTSLGTSTWSFNPTTGSTVQTGLITADHTAVTGVRQSYNQFQNASGQIAGYSTRYTLIDARNGENTWIFNPHTGVTIQTGLVTASYTNERGYQYSENRFQNAAGQVVGFSQRQLSGLSPASGSDTWYFDPLSGITHAIIGSTRILNNYAFSSPTLLTDSGFLLGNYLFFPGGLGDGERRAFIFRPDLGFTDLGALINGGLTASGWSTLQNPVFADPLNTIIGYGYVNGQTSGQSVFIMIIPAPASAPLLTLAALFTTRRRR